MCLPWLFQLFSLLLLFVRLGKAWLSSNSFNTMGFYYIIIYYVNEYNILLLLLLYYNYLVFVATILWEILWIYSMKLITLFVLLLLILICYL